MPSSLPWGQPPEGILSSYRGQEESPDLMKGLLIPIQWGVRQAKASRKRRKGSKQKEHLVQDLKFFCFVLFYLIWFQNKKSNLFPSMQLRVMANRAMGLGGMGSRRTWKGLLLHRKSLQNFKQGSDIVKGMFQSDRTEC